MTGIPFMCLGGWLKTNKSKFENLNNKKLTIILTATIICYIFEKLFVTLFSLKIDLVNTIMLVPLVAIIVVCLLNNPAENRAKLSHTAKSCANFMYYMHIACIIVLGRIVNLFYNGIFYGVIMFILVVIIMTITGLLFSKLKIAKKILG